MQFDAITASAFSSKSSGLQNKSTTNFQTSAIMSRVDMTFTFYNE